MRPVAGISDMHIFYGNTRSATNIPCGWPIIGLSYPTLQWLATGNIIE
jgi:hypothetical protein